MNKQKNCHLSKFRLAYIDFDAVDGNAFLHLLGAVISNPIKYFENFQRKQERASEEFNGTWSQSLHVKRRILYIVVGVYDFVISLFLFAFNLLRIIPLYLLRHKYSKLRFISRFFLCLSQKKKCLLISDSCVLVYKVNAEISFSDTRVEMKEDGEGGLFAYVRRSRHQSILE